MDSIVQTLSKTASVERAHDRMKTTPQGAGNTRRGLTRPIDSNNWGAAVQSTDDIRHIAGDFLLRARDDYDRAKRTRIAYILAAHKHGMSNVDIGALLGVSEAAVRSMIKRHGGDQ